MTWNDIDTWPGNYVMRWLAHQCPVSGDVTVVMAMCTPDGEWVSGREPSPTHYTGGVAWAEIEMPDAPVLIPAQWYDPNEVERR